MRDTISDLMEKNGWVITEIVSGGARGADKLAAKLAKNNDIPLVEFLADWDAYPRVAGFMRNSDIVNNSDVIVAFWNGSPGTGDSIAKAKEAGKELHIIRF